MKKYISLSGGVESSTMCLLYGKGANAIWSDTGAEEKPMYERIDLLEQFFTDFHKGDFNLIRIKPQVKIKGKILDNLLDAVIANEYMPSPTERYCTRQFKIEPIDNFLKVQGDCELMIGLNADEENSRIGNLMKCKNVTYTYPLVDEGLTRLDCENILLVNNIHPNFPAYMQRGGCSMCFYKSEKEYKALWYLDNEAFKRLIDFEIRYQGTKKKFYTIMPSGKSMQQLSNECKNELFTDEILEQYKNYSKNGKSCGAFCHR